VKLIKFIQNRRSREGGDHVAGKTTKRKKPKEKKSNKFIYIYNIAQYLKLTIYI
jgi:hypothetical protein